MLEEANYPIPNSDPFESDILPGVPVSNSNGLPFHSSGGESMLRELNPPPWEANASSDLVLQPHPSEK